MAWSVPDKGEGDHDHQAIYFREYFGALIAGLQGVDCVLSGCAITGGADMTPAVAAGVVRSNGDTFAVTAGDVTIGAAHATNPRFDLIVVDSSGVKQVRAGTAAANPKPPARSAHDVILAAVYVPANDTSIETTKITDLRVIRDFHAPRGHIFDLTMSNAADTANDITVQPGEATDENSDGLLVLTTAITKQIDVAWAVGTNAGGMNTGSVANSTWYEVHLIKRSDTGVVDVMFTTTGNRATLPTNYDMQRRIGWVRRDGAAALLQFFQDGDFFTLVTPINDIAASTTTTATLAVLTVPPNSVALYRATISVNTTTVGNSGILFRDPDVGSYAPDDLTGTLSLGNADVSAVAGAMAGHFQTRVNGSSQIEYDSEATTGTPTFDVSTYGWVDRRRRVAAI